MRNIRIPYHLSQSWNRVKGNKSVEKLEKANLAILYRNELDLEKQIITQELYGLKLPRDQVWKIMIRVKKDRKSSAYALISYLHFIIHII